jgi:hypothetical protein
MGNKFRTFDILHTDALVSEQRFDDGENFEDIQWD